MLHVLLILIILLSPTSFIVNLEILIILTFYSIPFSYYLDLILASGNYWDYNIMFITMLHLILTQYLYESKILNVFCNCGYDLADYYFYVNVMLAILDPIICGFYVAACFCCILAITWCTKFVVLYKFIVNYCGYG